MRVCECVLPSIHHSRFLIASYCWNARAPVTPRWEETLVLDVLSMASSPLGHVAPNDEHGSSSMTLT